MSDKSPSGPSAPRDKTVEETDGKEIVERHGRKYVVVQKADAKKGINQILRPLAE